MAHLPGKFVWFEHLSSQPAQARAFYEALFDWRCAPMPLPDGSIYQMILRDGRPDAPIGGFRAAPEGAPAQWLAYLSVDEVDAVNAAVLGAGGSSVLSPTDYGMFGRGAIVTDPQGAAFALWRGTFGDPADEPHTPPGGFHWNELITTDPHAAIAFYEQVFGYSSEAVPLTGAKAAAGAYYLLKDEAGRARAGVTLVPDPATPPMWLQYLAVADCDAAAGRAASLGGTIVQPPTDLPGVGRFAVIGDGTGAGVAVMGRPAA